LSGSHLSADGLIYSLIRGGLDGNDPVRLVICAALLRKGNNAIRIARPLTTGSQGHVIWRQRSTQSGESEYWRDIQGAVSRGNVQLEDGGFSTSSPDIIEQFGSGEFGPGP